MRHDELLQVILVESDAVRPICLLHRCAYWSAKACCRLAYKADMFWVDRCPLLRSCLSMMQPQSSWQNRPHTASAPHLGQRLTDVDLGGKAHH